MEVGHIMAITIEIKLFNNCIFDEEKLCFA